MKSLIIIAAAGLAGWYVMRYFSGNAQASTIATQGTYYRTLTTTTGETIELKQQGDHLIDDKGNIWT